MRMNLTGAAFATLLVFCTSFTASAQETVPKDARYEVNLTLGVVPGAWVSSKEFPNSTTRGKHDLYYFYEPYYSTGFFPEVSLDVNILLKKWLKVGGKAGYYSLWGDLIDPKTQRTIGRKEFSDFSLAGQVRFTLYEKPPFSAYAGVAVGATYRNGKDQGKSMSKLLPAYEYSPSAIKSPTSQSMA